MWGMMAWLFFMMTVFVTFWIIEKVMELVDYRQKRKTARLRDELIVSESSARHEIAQFHRARTWEVIRNNQRGEKFSEDEIRALETMGMAEYLEEDPMSGQ